MISRRPLPVDVDRVRAALQANVANVLDGTAIKYQVRGAELRTRFCPQCGERSRDSVCISVNTGAWIDHARGCRGDVFALVAGLAGLDVERDYPHVLELAAQLAELSPEEACPQRDHRVADRRVIDAKRHDFEQERASSRASMRGRWSALSQRHAVGERYLRDRGLDPHSLRNRGDLVRYTASGDPTLALRNLDSGVIVGLQSRRLGGDRKIHTEFGSQVAGAALAGRLTDLAPDGVDVAILVEGFADTLAAHLQWPGCAVFGAPGAAQLPAIAAAVARRVLEVRGWLLLAVDNDDTGVKHAGIAIVAATDAGLLLAPTASGLEGACTIRLVELGAHHDLADAYAAGWRWRWPEMSR